MNTSTNLHEIRANTFFVKGKVNFQNGKYEKCIRDLQYAESLFSTLNSKELAAESMLIISYAYLNLNQKKYALSSLNEAFHKFNELNNKQKKAECALKLGSLHRECENYDKSENFLNVSLNLYKDLGDDELIGDAWKELGNTYQKNSFYPESLDKTQSAYQQAIFYYKKSKSHEKKALTELDLALVLISQSEYKEAVKLLLSSLQHFEETKQDDFIVTITVQLVRLYLILEKKKKAIEYYDKAIDVMKKNNYSPDKIEQIKSLL
ncbi:MAG: tetratricopeptide repeat protein [Candidatus Heimdallarchaeaceae archaeon]